MKNKMKITTRDPYMLSETYGQRITMELTNDQYYNAELREDAVRSYITNSFGFVPKSYELMLVKEIYIDASILVTVKLFNIEVPKWVIDNLPDNITPKKRPPIYFNSITKDKGEEDETLS